MTAIFWGGTFVAGRAISQNVPPCSAAFLRFAVASALLLLLTWKVEGRIPPLKKSQILPVILLGMTGVFMYNIFFFKGLKLITAGRAALIIAMNPICISVLSALIFKEKLNKIQSAGILLSVMGAVVVITRGDMSQILTGGLGWGESFIGICVLCWVAFSLIGKTVLTGLSPLVSVSYSSTVGGAALLIPAYFEGVIPGMSGFTAVDWSIIFYLGICGTVIGFIWYYQGIQTIGPSKASLFLNFVPVSAIALGFFILKEPLTPSLFAGAALVIAGVYLNNTGGMNLKKIEA
jgi:drug/metabolite transporter (DMT)-like permease